MSALLQLIDINYSHSHQTLFNGLNLTINSGDKIGLVGHNGCGKSTLLSIIKGEREIDSGEIRKPNHVNVAIVEQFVPNHLLSLTLLAALTELFSADELLSDAWRAESQLLALGFSAEQFTIPVKGLSGGQQNLLLIARALLQQPQLLLMDEPGNHMDIAAMSRLEQFLTEQCQCSFLIISHDQHLLDNVCKKTVFMRDKRTYEFDLPFAAASEKLAENDQAAEKRLALEEKEIKRLQATAKRLAIWGREHDNESLSRKAKTFERRAQKLDEAKTEVSKGSGLNLTLKNHNLGAKQVLALQDCDIFTPDGGRKLLTIDELYIRPGDRVALLGINGVGKSTTLEAIRRKFAEHERESGAIRFNPRVELGYYDQQLLSLEQDKTRIDWLREATSANEDELKYSLINAGIEYEHFSRKVNSLSGGEKARMMFITFALNQPNFMILDEPTNHIDLAGKQQLTDELMASGATLLITSHDRYFLDQIATRWWWIDNQTIVEVTSAEPFYTSLLAQKVLAQKSNEQQQCEQSAVVLASSDGLDEDAMLARVDELERKLSEDKARKAKYQKPLLQQQWQQELDELWQKLET